MNPTEQKNRHRVTDELAKGMEDFAAATEDRFVAMERRILAAEGGARAHVDAERTFRLKMADEQRAYVDNEDRKLRQCCQERWDSTAHSTQQLGAAIFGLRDRGFWSRLNWLIRGR
jgi:hypothetical protein